MARGLIASLLVTAAIVMATPAPAHTASDPPHQLYKIGDFKLESGEVIKDFAISYVTHGTLNAQKSNAVLMTASISGNHHRIDFLIGPGKALDPAKYFIIATDAIGNGLTTSPSNSTSQHGMTFPHFLIRDMVESQRALLQHLGIRHLLAVTGASMGGMQSLQWAVSYPTFMDAVIALTPMARTPAWSVAVNETTRKALLADKSYSGGNYSAQPEGGWRAQTDVLTGLDTRTPAGLKEKFPNALDVIPWMQSLEDAAVKGGFDANNWLYQTWAYDRHNVATTPGKGFDGDLARALKSVTAKTVMFSSRLDLYNPVEEAKEAAQLIPGGQFVEIPSWGGHQAASAMEPAGVTFLNKAIIDVLTGAPIRS